MIRSNVVHCVPTTEKRERVVSLGLPRRRMRVASTETDKAALAIAREAERVRTIRLLVGGSDED
nr:hypothetical protein [Methylobacterium sp. L1A1]